MDKIKNFRNFYFGYGPSDMHFAKHLDFDRQL